MTSRSEWPEAEVEAAEAEGEGRGGAGGGEEDVDPTSSRLMGLEEGEANGTARPAETAPAQQKMMKTPTDLKDEDAEGPTDSSSTLSGDETFDGTSNDKPVPPIVTSTKAEEVESTKEEQTLDTEPGKGPGSGTAQQMSTSEFKTIVTASAGASPGSARRETREAAPDLKDDDAPDLRDEDEEGATDNSSTLSGDATFDGTSNGQSIPPFVPCAKADEVESTEEEQTAECSVGAATEDGAEELTAAGMNSGSGGVIGAATALAVQQKTMEAMPGFKDEYAEGATDSSSTLSGEATFDGTSNGESIPPFVTSMKVEEVDSAKEGQTLECSIGAATEDGVEELTTAGMVSGSGKCPSSGTVQLMSTSESKEKHATFAIPFRFPFPLDSRAVAMFRIALGLCAVCEWFDVFTFRELFLQDDGVFPRREWMDAAQQGDIYRFVGINLWMSAGSAEAVLVLLAVQLLLTIGLLVGYHSKLCSLVLFVFVNSWNSRLRAPVAGGGIEMVSVMLLWGAFLPLGRKYAVDATENEGGHRTEKGSGAAAKAMESLASFHDYFVSIAIPLHMAVMYYACGVIKQTEHWNSGNAVLMVVSSGMGTNQPFASIIAKMPMVCRFLTHATYYLETYGGFLLLVPSEIVRLAAVMALVPFHLGMHLALDIGMFQPAMMSALILLMPSQGCDVIEKTMQSIWQRVLLSVPQPWGVGLAPFRTWRQSAVSVGSCLGSLAVVMMAMVTVSSITNDLCFNLGRVSNGKQTCLLGHGRRYPASIQRWITMLGLPQHQSPYQNINEDEEFYHIVGLVEDHGDGFSADCESKVCPIREKTVAIFTDKTASQLNFDEKELWSPEQKPHVNARWMKQFMSHDSRKNGSFKDLADYICRNWNQRPGYPKLRSVATVWIRRKMITSKGALKFRPHKYGIVSHFKCLDQGQAGLASSSTLIDKKMKDVLGIEFMEISVKNNVAYPVRVYWVDPKSGMGVPKGVVPGKSRWKQTCRPGHFFKFYWNSPDGMHEREGLLAATISAGHESERNIILNSAPNWELQLKNEARYPLLVYWVHHDTKEEILKGRVPSKSTWSQQAGLGNEFHLYWDTPNKKLLAQEVRVKAEKNLLTINEPKKISIQNAAPYPLLIYWVHPGTAVEIEKVRINENSTKDYETYVGHISRLYWDLTDVKDSHQEERILAREFWVSSAMDKIRVGDRFE